VNPSSSCLTLGWASTWARDLLSQTDCYTETHCFLSWAIRSLPIMMVCISFACISVVEAANFRADVSSQTLHSHRRQRAYHASSPGMAISRPSSR
jgi:hypothetical protein